MVAGRGEEITVLEFAERICSDYWEMLENLPLTGAFDDTFLRKDLDAVDWEFIAQLVINWKKRT